MPDNSTMKSIVLAFLLCASYFTVVAAERKITVLPTGSMEPTLTGGDVLTVESVPFEALRVGDIIVVRTRKFGLIVHRIVEIRRGKLWTKGDANFRRDAFWVRPDHVVGRVKGVRRGP